VSLVLVVREAVRGLFRTGPVGLVSVLAIAASLLVLGVFVQASVGALSLARSVRERVELDVYLKPDVSRKGALSLAGDLQALPGVASAYYVSQDSAAAEFRSQFGPDLLDGLSTNPLPASIRVRVRGEGDLAAAVRAVRLAASDRREVESVEAGEEWVTAFDRTLDRALVAAMVLGGALCLACFFAVANTAKLMVLSQREVIEVMRMMGATARVIRMTFLLGGMLQGVAGGLIAAAGSLFLHSLRAPWVFEGLAMAGIPGALPALGSILLGAFLGLLGSWASLNRVLKAVAWRG
jgi:cell division transport system permease protein